jgi:hypothetical protein
MVFINGQQIPEGIDKITVIMHPSLGSCYRYWKYTSPNTKVSIRRKSNKYNNFSYLDIQAEELHHSPNMLRNIAHVIYGLVNKGILVINRNAYWDRPDDYSSQDKEFEITEDFVFKNIRHFIIGVSEIEFFFDMPREAIRLAEDAVVFDVETMNGVKSFRALRETDKTTRMFAKYKGTLYSRDYVRLFRYSTLKWYDSANKDIGVNQTKLRLINSRPNKARIEFRLTRSNSPYLAIANIDGTYEEIIQRFTPLLSILYNKYFSGKVLVDTNQNTHPYFSAIYGRAKEGKLRYTQDDLLKYKGDGSIRFRNDEIVMGYEHLLYLLDHDDTVIKYHNHHTTPNVPVYSGPRDLHNTLLSRLSGIKQQQVPHSMAARGVFVDEIDMGELATTDTNTQSNELTTIDIDSLI